MGLCKLAQRWELAAVVPPTRLRRAGVPDEGDPVILLAEPVARANCTPATDA
ncbi:MAG: hypothetical protein MUF54_16405 [Polyangiaceae bacterium]|nr:hypothetical protein [Polyangiaceae bacterium]